MGTPFKMKGSPFQRNYGIGAPLKQVKQEITTGYSNHRTNPGSTTTVRTVGPGDNIHKITTLDKSGEILSEGGGNSGRQNTNTKTNTTKFDGTKRSYNIEVPKKSTTAKVVKVVKSGLSKGLRFLGGRASGVFGLLGAGTLSASASNPQAKKSEGEQIKNLLKKHNLKGGNARGIKY